MFHPRADADRAPAVRIRIGPRQIEQRNHPLFIEGEPLSLVESSGRIGLYSRILAGTAQHLFKGSRGICGGDLELSQREVSVLRSGADDLHIESGLAQIQHNALRGKLHRAIAVGAERERSCRQLLPA